MDMSRTNNTTAASRGAPEATVLAVLDQYIVTCEGEGDDTPSFIDALTYQRLSTYITGCQGAMLDPLAEVIIIQDLLQEFLEYSYPYPYPYCVLCRDI